jgi:hypothetical protein
MKIDEVINAVLKKHFDWRKVNIKGIPNLAVYMSDDFYGDCMQDLRGELSPYQDEFMRDMTIHGYPVYPVIKMSRSKVEHPDFRVVNLD